VAGATEKGPASATGAGAQADGGPDGAIDPVEALERIAYLLERDLQPTYRVKAFRTAAAKLSSMPPDEVGALARAGRLRSLPGIGETTEKVVLQALAGETPAYLRHLEGDPEPATRPGQALCALLKGDCHTHSDWSDGGSTIEAMARTAQSLGHEYVALTDHSPRLTVARGLSADRLRAQLDVVADLNERLAPFRILTGIEVDILDDGSLDQDEDLLASLEVVVASVHSGLRMEARPMTARMVTALSNPNVDILGHCTGRIVVGKGRPESTFDADAVFATAARLDKAIEVNSRPERLDPPRRLLRQALDAGCRLAVDTDAHAPGQLEWQWRGCDRVVECGGDASVVVNTGGAEDVVAWTAGHGR
jgi:putative hydrolase